ncbi:hypothetical protein BDV28DRAFT_149363 [Aspergillus coremiiformis]|uniref:Uncharacterized protein n=1 Tax=Aspergillus coremiiformis TaxID=138285 RepID=A0A5N6Z4Q2_9EURO|nr:hypothetical protein BDV28DRAFT_149363 [Aspergillus coremiiformis]
MISPTSFAVSRQAPPVRPSRSLEGLEKVIPPPPARSAPWLDKPLPELPAKPLPDTPSMETPTAWCDDSSTDVSFETRRASDASAESYPVFVHSASDDLAEFAEHSHVPGTPVRPYRKPGPSPLAFTTSSGDHHDLRPFLTGGHVAPNHYFREKKWDFFPELATPSELSPGYPKFPLTPRKHSNNRMSLAALDFTKKGSRWAASDKRAPTSDVRNSIRSYIQRTLSRHSINKTKPKRRPELSTSPSDFREEYESSRKTASSNYSNYSDRGSTGPQQNFLDLSDELKRMSVTSYLSSESDRSIDSTASHQKKEVAARSSALQKYKPIMWEKPGHGKRISYRQRGNVRFPNYRKKTISFRCDPSSKDTPSSACSALQQSTRFCVRVLQDGTSCVLIALDGARRRIIQAKVDRRRRLLKSKIRIIGPVNAYTTYDLVDPWI